MRFPADHSGSVQTMASSCSTNSSFAANPTAVGTAPASVNEQKDVPDAPVARVLPEPPTGVPVTIHASQQEKTGDSYELRGEVEIDYADYIVRADRITYNAATGEVVAEGHLQVDGGPNNEQISASHGVLNLNTQTGRFYDVIGSVGVKRTGGRSVYTTPNPFIMTGRELLKNGPASYEMFGGSMTSCQLPDPHWRIMAPHIVVDDGRAKAWNSNFRLMGYPILYLPYVTHGVDTSGRQSGFLIPELETGSAIKGTVIGDSYYWAINRSADLTLGFQYYSLRGPEQSAEFRYRGHGNDMIHGHYRGLEDRGLAPLYANQGGQDTLVAARHDFTTYSRAVINAEYLSSYVYRQVFSENFSQAISSEVKSWGFVTHEENGYAGAFELERYQNYASTMPGDEIRLLHLPNLQFDALDHELGHSSIFLGGSASFGLLSRSQPFYRSHNVGRTDIFPHLTLPWIADGWTFRPTVGFRDTFYSHSQKLGPVPLNFPGEDAVPITEDASLNRKAMEADFQVLPPVLERDFTGDLLARHFGVAAVRHTIEPEFNYRYVAGVNKFNHAPRFDPVDIYSDTNEVEYGLTQRLFLKWLRPRPCVVVGLSPGLPQRETKDCEEASRQWLSWFVGQKYFMEPSFGGAVIPGRRNIFSSTVDFSGIAYITAPRSVSPIVSRLRVNASANTDIEWDLDYDTKAGRVAGSNVFANYRHGNFFSSFGHAVLNAVGETPEPPQVPANVVNYNQMQLLFGYGALTKPGLSAAASGGFDLNRDALEYAGVQATYNFDCCGFTVEYRKFELGAIRNESQESFSFTLAGVGAAGNLKRAERLF